MWIRNFGVRMVSDCVISCSPLTSFNPLEAPTLMPQKTPRCPECGKAFNDERQVQRHLDQPQSRCNRDDVQFVNPLELLRLAEHGSRSAQVSHDDSDGSVKSVSMESLSISDDGIPETANSSPKEYFEGAAKVYGNNGRTFLKAFDEDQFADIRQSNNLYYPFADRPEWDLAEFLLTSPLSMADINRFFSLTLVCCSRFQ